MHANFMLAHACFYLIRLSTLCFSYDILFRQVMSVYIYSRTGGKES